MSPPADRPERYKIELAASKCSLCELCARHCPSGALRIERGNGRLRLLFSSDACDGCPGGDSCVQSCPEDAILLSDAPAGANPTSDLLLIEGELARCSYCNAEFAPMAKLERLAEKAQTKHDLIRDLCPLCRRTQLVVSFIEQHRDPGGKAEYRSTKDILRRAAIKIVEEDQ